MTAIPIQGPVVFHGVAAATPPMTKAVKTARQAASFVGFGIRSFGFLFGDSVFVCWEDNSIFHLPFTDTLSQELWIQTG